MQDLMLLKKREGLRQSMSVRYKQSFISSVSVPLLLSGPEKKWWKKKQ